MPPPEVIIRSALLTGLWCHQRLRSRPTGHCHVARAGTARQSQTRWDGCLPDRAAPPRDAYACLLWVGLAEYLRQRLVEAMPSSGGSAELEHGPGCSRRAVGRTVHGVRQGQGEGTPFIRSAGVLGRSRHAFGRIRLPEVWNRSNNLRAKYRLRIIVLS